MPAKGCKQSAEARAKISKAKTGFHHSEEAKLKMSIAKKGKVPWHKGTKGLIIPWNKGKHGIYSDEYKAKLSNARKKFKFSEEHKRKISEANKCRRVSEETKLKISKSHIGIRPNEETRRKLRSHGGPEHPLWTGGDKVSKPKSNAKRKRELGFILLNDYEDLSWVGHHLDKDHVLYIPKELHTSVPHTQKNKESMDKINEIAINWYINYYGLI